MIDRLAIRALAHDHIRELGLSAPPFDERASLQHRRLDLLDAPLDAVLADSNLPEEARDKIDGFVDLVGRIVCLRSGLHPHQYRTGLLHEVAHDVIPWQRDLLHYCPIFSLPPELQHDFEREANLFVVECGFFGDAFLERIQSHPAHLDSAVMLAHEHAMSYAATFRHYVECQTLPCLLLVSTLHGMDRATGEAVFEVRQYIKSPAASLVIRPRQRFQSPELANLIAPTRGFDGVTSHTIDVENSGDCVTFAAQSFWNTYKLFTLVWL